METNELANLLPPMIRRNKDENNVINGEMGLLRIDKEDDFLWAVYYYNPDTRSVYTFNNKKIITRSDTLCEAFENMKELLTKCELWTITNRNISSSI